MTAAAPSIDAALAYAGRGWRVHPIRPGTKHPRPERWQDVATTDIEMIAQWWKRWPDHGVGIATGEASGVWVLDVDCADGKVGFESLRSLEAAHGPLPDTVEAITPTGGRHLYFRHPEGLELNNSAGRLGPDLDIRANGGQVLAAPSLHPVTGTAYTWDLAHHPADMPVADAPTWLLELLKTQPKIEVDRSGPRPTYEQATLARDRFNYHPAASDHVATILTDAGWTEGRQGRDGTRYLTRPGKDDGISATLDKVAPGVLFVFTGSTEFKDDRAYDPFDVLCLIRHGGDREATDRSLVEHGWGVSLFGGDLTTLGPAQAPTRPVDLTRWLPDEFWTARPELALIRQAAQSKQRSADAVLHVILARIAAAIPHTLKLPGIVGSPAPLCWFSVLLGPPGVGKGNASAIGKRLLPMPVGLKVSEVPLGSGEGLVDVLFEWIDEDDPDTGKKRKVKRQTRHNAFVYVDEGQAMHELGGRSGATLLSTIRSIWSGGLIGNQNAGEANHRIAPEGTYTYGLVVGLQDAKAGPLLDDAGGGTPQRFGWASVLAPNLPDQLPDWPGELNWTAPSRHALDQIRTMHGAYIGHELVVARPVAQEVQARDLARQKGEVILTEMGAHGDLVRLKAAALLALLGGRLDVTEDDWDLAGTLKDTSDAVRDHAANVVRDAAQDREKSTTKTLVRRSEASQVATRRRRIVECAQGIGKRVQRDGVGEWSVSDIRRAMRSFGDVIDDGLEQAISEGWVVELAEPGQGTPRRALNPGPVKVSP